MRNQSKQSHTIVCVLIPCSVSHTRYFRKQTINFKLLQHTQICAHIFHGFRPPLLHADTCTHTYGTETQNLFIINARIKGEQTQNTRFFFFHTPRTDERALAGAKYNNNTKKTLTILVKSISVLFSSSQSKGGAIPQPQRVQSRPWQQHKAYSHNTQSLLRVLSTAASKYLKISLHKK